MAKKKKREEREQNSTVVLFVALMLILLSFFIMLNTMAVFDDRKVRLAIGSLLGEFGTLTGGIGSLGSTSSIDLGPHPYVDPKHIQQTLDRLKTNTKVAGDVAVEVRDDDLVLTVNGDLALDDPKNTPGAVKPVLDKIAELLKKSTKEVRLEGHVAGQLPEGERPVDHKQWSKSLRLAENLAGYLLASSLPEERLVVAGYGATRPLRSFDAAGAWDANRRVEIVVVDGANDPALRFRPVRVRIGGQQRFELEAIDENGAKRWKR